MAEIVGLVASVVQLAGAGLKLSQTLYQYADGVATADRRIKNIAKEVKLTSFVIQELGDIFKQDETANLISDNAVKTATETIKECSAVFTEIEMTITKSNTGSIGRLMLPFRDKKIELLRSQIDKLKSTLELLMQVLMHAHQVSSNKLNREAEAKQREEIKQLLENKKQSTKRYESLRNLNIDHDNTATGVGQRSLSGQTGSISSSTLVMAASAIGSTLDPKTLATCVDHVRSLLKDIETLQQALSVAVNGDDHSDHHQKTIDSYFAARSHLDSVLLGSSKANTPSTRTVNQPRSKDYPDLIAQDSSVVLIADRQSAGLAQPGSSSRAAHANHSSPWDNQIPPSYYTQQGPRMASRGPSNFATHDLLRPLTTQTAREQQYSARYGQPRNITLPRFSAQLQFEEESYESESDSDTESSDCEDWHFRRQIIPPPKLARTRSKPKLVQNSLRVSESMARRPTSQSRNEMKSTAPNLRHSSMTPSRVDARLTHDSALETKMEAERLRASRRVASQRAESKTKIGGTQLKRKTDSDALRAKEKRPTTVEDVRSKPDRRGAVYVNGSKNKENTSQQIDYDGWAVSRVSDEKKKGKEGSLLGGARFEIARADSGARRQSLAITQAEDYIQEKPRIPQKSGNGHTDHRKSLAHRTSDADSAYLLRKVSQSGMGMSRDESQTLARTRKQATAALDGSKKGSRRKQQSSIPIDDEVYTYSSRRGKRLSDRHSRSNPSAELLDMSDPLTRPVDSYSPKQWGLSKSKYPHVASEHRKASSATTVVDSASRKGKDTVYRKDSLEAAIEYQNATKQYRGSFPAIQPKNTDRPQSLANPSYTKGFDTYITPGASRGHKKAYSVDIDDSRHSTKLGAAAQPLSTPLSYFSPSTDMTRACVSRSRPYLSNSQAYNIVPDDLASSCATERQLAMVAYHPGEDNVTSETVTPSLKAKKATYSRSGSSVSSTAYESPDGDVAVRDSQRKRRSLKRLESLRVQPQEWKTTEDCFSGSEGEESTGSTEMKDEWDCIDEEVDEVDALLRDWTTVLG